MPSRQKINWRIPTSEWDAFKDHVCVKHGEVTGNVGQEVTSAMREWIDADDYDTIETWVDRLIRAAGRTPADLSGEKISQDALADNGETAMVRTRVDPDLKTAFKAFVNEHTDDRLGIQLAKALRERRQGGRARRIEHKLSRIQEDTEDFLAHLDGNETLPKADREAIEIGRRLPEDEFMRADLQMEIEDVTGRDTDYILNDRTERVLDRLDVVAHPNNPALFVSEDRAKQIDSHDAPAVDRKDYSDLSREEKVEGVRIALARTAERNGGNAAFRAGTIKREVFNSRPSDSHLQQLMALASEGAGYRMGSHPGDETKQVMVDLPAVSEAILNAAGSRT